MAEQKNGLSDVASAAVAIGVVAAAALAGRHASPTRNHPQTRNWYRDLEKPGFMPPAAVYGIAWTGVQAALAYGGYRLLRHPPSPGRTRALSLWGINQAAIAGWSEIFFGLRAPGMGALAAGGMVATAAGYVAAAAREDDQAAAAGVPLTLWVAFATLLAEEIWRRTDQG